MIQQFILFFHLILAVTLIGLVLIQHGKGADAGAAFGSGASGTVFGSQGSGNFLTRLTTTIACLLAVTSVSLTLLANKSAKPASLADKIIKQESSVPAAPATPATTDVPEVPATPAAADKN